MTPGVTPFRGRNAVAFRIVAKRSAQSDRPTVWGSYTDD